MKPKRRKTLKMKKNKNGGGINYAWTVKQGKTLWWYEGATGHDDLSKRITGNAYMITKGAKKPKGLRTSSTRWSDFEWIRGSKVTVRKNEKITGLPKSKDFSDIDVVAFKEQIGINTVAEAISDLRAEGLNVKLINTKNAIGPARVGRFSTFVERHCAGNTIDQEYYNQVLETVRAVFNGTDNPIEQVSVATGLNDLSKVNETKLTSKKPVSKIVRKKARRRNQSAA